MEMLTVAPHGELESLRAALKEARADQLHLILSDLQERFPKLLQPAAMEIFNRANSTAAQRRPFKAGLICATDIPPGVVATRLWFGLYPATVSMIIGETGAGKSTLFYNIVSSAARNDPYLDVPFGLHRPLQILYVDPENSGNWDENNGGQCARKLDRIDGGRPKHLFFHDGRGINLSDPSCMAELSSTIEEMEIDIVFLDPIANLFNTVDENDNAEAARQMKALTDLSRATGASIACCHHTGKDTNGNYGRGASARLAAADVGIVFRARGETEDLDDDFMGQLRERDDVCRLQIVKNRIEGRASIFLQMAGNDRFQRVDFEAWKRAPHSSSNRSQDAEKEIRLFLADNLEHSRTEILEAMQREGFGRPSVDSTLDRLVANTEISTRRGPHNTRIFWIAAADPNVKNVSSDWSDRIP